MSIFGSNTPAIYYGSFSGAVTFTTDYAVEDTYIEKSGHGLSVGDIIHFSSTGTLPAGIVSGYYYVVSEIISTDYFTISRYGTGDTVQFTNDGTGTHSYYVMTNRVTFEHFNLDEKIVSEDYFLTSTVDGTKNFVEKGLRLYFTITENLYKYSDSGKSKYKEILDLRGKPLYFFKHLDNFILLRDSDGNPITFYISGVDVTVVSQANYKESISITLTASDYYDVDKTLGT